MTSIDQQIEECKKIAESSSVQDRFKRILSISAVTKLADLLVSPKTSLPWLVNAVGGPAWVIPLLVPVKESGSMLPQWLLRHHIAHRFTNRTRLWRIGAVVQALGIAAIALFAFMLSGQVIGGQVFAIGLIALLALTSLGRAVCSLMMKDIQAESVEKGRRGKLVGLAASISGALTLLFACGLYYYQVLDNVSHLLLLIILGSLLFLAAFGLSFGLAVCYRDAPPDSTDSMLEPLRRVARVKALRDIVISRLLLLHSVLAVPLLVNAAAQSSVSQLALFIGLSAAASMLSSYVWGHLSDTSARLTLRVASMVCALTLGLFFVFPESPMVVMALFFALNLGHAGLRTGRKTYLLDVTSTDNRADYVATANTLVGIGLLLLGGLYALLFNHWGNMVVVLMAITLLFGFLHTWQLKAEK